MPKSASPLCTPIRKRGHLHKIQQQLFICSALRCKSPTHTISRASDPLALIYQDLLMMMMRNLSVPPALRLQRTQPLHPGYPLLLRRFRALLFKYRQHGFSFETFIAAPTEYHECIHDIFIRGLTDPFQDRGTGRERDPRKALLRVTAHQLPKVKKTPIFFVTNPIPSIP